jgi:hypothetical protein
MLDAKHEGSDTRGMNKLSLETRVQIVSMHKALGATPAMAAGLVGRVRKMTGVMALIDAASPVPAIRGPYKEGVEISN